MQEKAEFLSTLISARVDKCEKALERNWIAHIILAGIGLAFVFDLGGLPRALASRFFGPDHYNNLLPPMLMTPILLYSSTRLGQLLISFVRARRIQDELLTRILQDDPLGKYLEERSADLRPLFQTSSFFETYYSTTFDKGSVFSFLAITCGVVSTAQAAALFLIWKASDYTPWSIIARALCILCGGILLYAYVRFWVSQKNQPKTRKGVRVTIHRGQ